MAWAIIKIHTSKCAHMDPQRLPNTCRSKEKHGLQHPSTNQMIECLWLTNYGF